MSNTFSYYLIYFLIGFESHATEGSKQTSLYVRLTASLWLQTTILTAIITPWSDRLNDGSTGLLQSIYAIFVFEIIRGPVMQVVDIPGNFNRHFFAPRAPDQRRMNLCFQGTKYSLADRYKSMTNILFLTFYYSSIFPGGFLLSALALAIHYWADKFCILRSWTQIPSPGANIAKFSGYFLMAAILFFVVVSTYMFAGFPFDNACPLNSVASEEYVGDFIAYDLEGNEIDISVNDDDENYLFCQQDLFRQWKLPLPNSWYGLEDGEKWMTQDQEMVVFYCAMLSCGYVMYLLLISVSHFLYGFIKDIFTSTYEPDGEASTQGFSEVNGIKGYIPQAKIPGYPFPVLLCHTSGINKELIGWKSPRHSHKYYNVILDVPGLEKSELTQFAITKQWAPSKTHAPSEPAANFCMT